MGVTYKTPTPVIVPMNIFDPTKNCWKQACLKVEDVQKISLGEKAVLGYIDDGVGMNTELINLDIERWSYFENSGPTGEHSTHGVTIISGNTFGIFPALKIVSKQVLDPITGVGGSAEIVAAIMNLKQMGVQTINLSFGADAPDRKIEEALKSYCDNGINIANVSAGNDGPGPNTTDWPANFAKNIKGVLSTAATAIDTNGNITVAVFSSRGTISISAPGHGLKTMGTNSLITFVSGTSFSTPIVSSVIAVARTLIDRPLYQDEILDILDHSSKHEYKVTEGGNGNIDIVEFFRQVKLLPKEYTPKNVKPKSFCERIKSYFV